MLRTLCIALVCLAPIPGAIAQLGGGPVFDEAWRLVRDEFYDPGLHGVDWEAVRAEMLPLAERAGSPAHLSAVINGALDRLHASHTAHYHAGQAAYHELLDVFSAPGEVWYIGIGVATTITEGRIFVADVYDGGPAHRAGLLAGDEIVSVEGEPWADADSFRDREGVATTIALRRDGPDEPPRTLRVIPERIQPHALFLSGIAGSARTIPHGDAAIAYIRVRSYASREYHEAVMDLVRGDLAGADALVLDIRGGWGGANPSYMSLVNPVVPTVAFKPRAEEWRTFDDAWHKPVVLLVDGGSRSGKEILAYAYRKHGLARLVGERTAGAVLGGKPLSLGDGSLLYVAVSDVLVEGERLEGVGVDPDVHVARELPYSGGRDPQLAVAVAEAARLAAERVRAQDR